MKPTGIQRKAMGEPDNSPRPLLVEIKERLNHTRIWINSATPSGLLTINSVMSNGRMPIKSRRSSLEEIPDKVRDDAPIKKR